MTMAHIKSFTFNPFAERTRVLRNEGPGCIVVDPGCCNSAESAALDAFIEEKGLTVQAIILTHCHIDHIYGCKALQERFHCPVYMHKAELANLDIVPASAARYGIGSADTSFEKTFIEDGDMIRAAGFELEVISTPGHAPGAVCYYDRTDGILFSGDTLFAGAIGRSDLPFGNYDDEIVSIMDKVMGLDGDVEVFPGHGPDTTIGWERTHNPFLQPFNEKEEEFDPDAEGIQING